MGQEEKKEERQRKAFNLQLDQLARPVSLYSNTTRDTIATKFGQVFSPINKDRNDVSIPLPSCHK